MLRLSLIALTMVLLNPMILGAEEIAEGMCTILNTSARPIVIGLYQPSEDGVKERLVNISPKTQVEKIPLQLVADQQFAVAYEASLHDGVLSRSEPIFILGQTRLVYIKKSSESNSPDVLLRYRGGRNIDRSHPDTFSIALQAAPTERAAKTMIQSANHTSEIVEAPLAQQSYSEGAEPE